MIAAGTRCSLIILTMYAVNVGSSSPWEIHNTGLSVWMSHLRYTPRVTFSLPLWMSYYHNTAMQWSFLTLRMYIVRDASLTSCRQTLCESNNRSPCPTEEIWFVWSRSELIIIWPDIITIWSDLNMLWLKSALSNHHQVFSDHSTKISGDQRHKNDEHDASSMIALQSSSLIVIQSAGHVNSRSHWRHQKSWKVVPKELITCTTSAAVMQKNGHAASANRFQHWK